MSRSAQPQSQAERSQALLDRLEVPAEARAELLAYLEHPYAAAPANAPLPLPDEPHVAAWQSYAEEAEHDGAAVVLRRRLVQLRYPVAAGTSTDERYRSAVLRGAEPPPEDAGVAWADPAGVTLTIHPTPAGHLPVVTTRAREDFVTLARALTARNEPIEVPETVGACLVKGLVNQDRIARHRVRWLASGSATEGWPAELSRLAADKSSYQDRLVVLSDGPYSAVAAHEAGLDEEVWRERSLAIRRDHECFHYLTLRRFGLMRSNALDEVVADAAGLLGAYGEYHPALARRFLGLEPGGGLRAGARLLVYCRDLSATAREPLVRFVDAAIVGVERLLYGRGASPAPPDPPPAGPASRDGAPPAASSAKSMPPGWHDVDQGARGELLLALAGRGLEGLAAAGTAASR